MSFESMWSALEPVGVDRVTGGYNRFAWTSVDLTLRDWFAGEATARGLDVTVDRAGNQWAWWGDPDADGPGVVIGSHLDSVPDGGAFDGPLGVVSSFAAVDALRAQGFRPTRPVGVANFGDEEGARFGIACAGSRLLTGALDADRALALRDGDGVTLADALVSAGRSPQTVGRDDETLRRIATFVELHVEQGRHLVHLDQSVGVCSAIWPHGRFRLDIGGEANHAGTTKFEDRDDPMLRLARAIQAARDEAQGCGAVATVGKVFVEPNAVNAIPSRVTAWVDVRAAEPPDVWRVVHRVSAAASVVAVEESFTDRTEFDPSLAARLVKVLGEVPLMSTAAGHDAGILSSAGIPTAMLFVRNPTGVSHSPREQAERADCLAGVDALARVVEELSR